MQDHRAGFGFGLEVELLLVDATSYHPLWHPDLQFTELRQLLEGISLEGVGSLEGLALEPPHRMLLPYVVEGYHLPAAGRDPAILLPKGVEIRTPVCATIDACIGSLRLLHARLEVALMARGYRAVALSFHPYEHAFSGPQNKRRYDFWQWAMRAMLTYGPDVNVSLPSELAARLDFDDLFAKVNYYVPALTALTVASPIYRGELWRLEGRVGKSVRTHVRSVQAPALEVHPNERGRLELKAFETPRDIDDFRGYFLLWLTLLLDAELDGRADAESRVYDLGQVARRGLGADTVISRAATVLERAAKVLPVWGFDPTPLARFERRLDARSAPADDLVALFEQHRSVPRLLRGLALR